VKSAEEIMNILEAYDLTGSLRDAAELAACSHHTVARYVQARERGRLAPGVAAHRVSVVDPFLEKLEELVDRSHGKIRADVAHEKITAMGMAGRSGRPGGRSRRSRPPGVRAAAGCTGRGFPSRGCGRSTTSATGRRSGR